MTCRSLPRFYSPRVIDGGDTGDGNGGRINSKTRFRHVQEDQTDLKSSVYRMAPKSSQDCCLWQSASTQGDPLYQRVSGNQIP